MNMGEYPKHAVIMICGFLFFFLGFALLFERDTLLNILTLFVVVVITIALSYGNRSPVGGLVLGFFASISFILGLFVSICSWELSEAVVANRDWTLGFLGGFLSAYGTGFLSAAVALCSIGLFCGLLGYVFGHISTDVSFTQPRIFRDYWSSVLQLGKSDKREDSYLDRKLSSWSLGKEGWWKRLVEKLIEPQPDLLFVAQSAKSSGEARGNLFDVSSGRMVGEGLTDPYYLVSKFRPTILKVATTSAKSSGARRLTTETLIERLLRRLIPSPVIWFFYLSLTVILTGSVYLVWTNNLAAYPYYVGADLQVLTSAIVSSTIILFFVWRWRKTSKILFQRRPDEKILIFLVYVILALLFGFCYDVIVNPPGDFARALAWEGSWFVWTRWFLFLTFILGIGYILIHRECEMVNTYFYDNRPEETNANRVSPFKKVQDEPFWLKDEKAEGGNSKSYWVLRFMYFWKYELAIIPHPDWERVEVWIDAEKGTPEWVVTDYHYRELWYKVKGDLQTLYVRFLMNFHTPIPVIDTTEAERIVGTVSLNIKETIRTLFSGKNSEIYNSSTLALTEQNWSKLHPAEWVQRYGLSHVSANFCSRLNWTYWRYPFGVEKAKEYARIPAVTPEEEPEGSH